MKRLFIVLALLVTSFFCFGEGKHFYKLVNIGETFDSQIYQDNSNYIKYTFVLNEFYNNDKTSLTLKFIVIVFDVVNDFKYTIPLTYNVNLEECFTVGLFDKGNGDKFIIRKINDNNSLVVSKIVN